MPAVLPVDFTLAEQLQVGLVDDGRRVEPLVSPLVRRAAARPESAVPRRRPARAGPEPLYFQPAIPSKDARDLRRRGRLVHGQIASLRARSRADQRHHAGSGLLSRLDEQWARTLATGQGGVRSGPNTSGRCALAVRPRRLRRRRRRFVRKSRACWPPTDRATQLPRSTGRPDLSAVSPSPSRWRIGRLGPYEVSSRIGAGWDGRRLQGHRYTPRSYRRDQDPPGPLGGRSLGPPALRARGARRRRPQPPTHLHAVRRRAARTASISW